MPQLIIDTMTESPQGLRRAAAFLLVAAEIAERGEDADLDATLRQSMTAPQVNPVSAGTKPPAPPIAPAPGADHPPASAVVPPPPPPAAAVAPPPPPPPPAAEQTTPPAPPVPPAAEELFDSKGYPWDARIHSSNKTKNADQTWRLRKKLEPALVTAVMAELESRRRLAPVVSLPVPPPPAAIPAGSGVPAPPPPAGDVVDPAATFAHNTPGVPAPGFQVPAPPPATTAAASGTVAPATTPPPPPPADANVPPASTFRGFMQKVSALIQAGKLSNAEVNGACAAVGVQNMQMLISQPMLIPAVSDQIDAITFGR